MPQLINDGFDLKLTMPSSNKKETALFLNSQPSSYPLPDFAFPAGYRLLASNKAPSADGTLQTICLIYTGSGEPETIYKVKIIARYAPNAYLSIPNCTQLLVWRQISGQHGHVLWQFARKVFDHLLSLHNIMITDEQQTVDGKRFWLDRLGESLAMPDRHVYYIDLSELDADKSPKVTEITSLDSLMENFIPNGWGFDETHKDRAFLISKTALLAK